MYLLSIDPANVESAYVLIDADTYKPVEFGKLPNYELLSKLSLLSFDKVAIEMVACYGMPVGATVFDTCVWIGRFVQCALLRCGELNINFIYRKEEKMNLCNSMKAKDSNIRQALIDRFGDVGTKKNKGFFYGFKADIWAAFAVGVTYLDKVSSYN